MTLPSALEISPNVVARMVDGETVILDLDKGAYFGLDDVGARIWSLAGQGRSPAEICDVLLDEYDVTREKLEADIVRLAAELEKEGLVRVRA